MKWGDKRKADILHDELLKRKRQEEEWDKHAEDDYDDHQKGEIEMAAVNTGLPIDIAFKLPYQDQIRNGKSRLIRTTENRDIHVFWFLFRKKILHRDHYQCVECGNTEELMVHHILGVSDLPQEEFTEDNCVTLCGTCHRLRHNKIKEGKQDE